MNRNFIRVCKTLGVALVIILFRSVYINQDLYITFWENNELIILLAASILILLIFIILQLVRKWNLGKELN